MFRQSHLFTALLGLGISASAQAGTPISYAPATTLQYNLNGLVPTGQFYINGLVADGGAVDGLVFGLYWKDASGGYHMLKSNSSVINGGSDFYAMWPSGTTETTFGNTYVPHVSDQFARNQSYSVPDSRRQPSC